MENKETLELESIEVELTVTKSDSNCKITYGPHRKIYESKLALFFGDSFSVPSGKTYNYRRKEETDTYSWVIENIIKGKYMIEVRKNPNTDLDMLVKSLTSQANTHIHNRNDYRSTDSYNDFYDSTDSNHWRES